MPNITMTIEELQYLLNAQKRETSEYICRNLTCYSWYKSEIDGDTVRRELKEQCLKSGYAPDFNVLKKYIKPS